MEKKRDPYLHCYNLDQARFFKNECDIKEVNFDFSPQNKRVYFLFERGDKLDKAFELWHQNKNKCED